MVSGGRAFRWLGPEGGDLLNAISTLIKQAPERSLDPLLPCEDREKWELSTNQKVGSHHTLNCWCPDLGFLNLQNYEQKFLLLISHPVCGVLLQPERTVMALRANSLLWLLSFPTLLGRTFTHLTKCTSRITSSMFPVPSTSSLMWRALFSDPTVPHESFRPSISKSTHWRPFLFPF